MATTTGPGFGRRGVIRWLEVAALAVLAYLPPLLSSPGRVSADSKQYLYIDPGAFLARAPYMWDAQVAAGGVSHQHLGYLWPMGTWFWVLDGLGVPPWVAQRLWLGTVALVAALGTRWLLRRMGLSRAGVLVGSLVYLLTPYQLAFTARSSVLLLPWAGLPWLLGLTDRAMRRGGWRDPAFIALIVLTIGAVNASSLVLVGIGPLVWLLLGITDRERARRAAGVAARVGLLGVGVSLWWSTGLRLEGAYGLPVLQVTENLESVAASSSPLDVLRGLGNWFFYGRDRLGFSIDQAQDYLDDRLTVWATFGLAALGVAAAILVRWRHRARFASLVLVGTVVSVGAWPLDDPSPFARGVAEVTRTSAGLALRNTARAAPLVVLGLAGLLGAAVSAWPRLTARGGAVAAVVLLALAGFAPVARTGMLSDHVDRVDPLPAHWLELAADLDAAGSSTRVLEIPGTNFAAHRWGNTVDPILPGLMSRGHIAREVLPQGSPSSVLLLDALDRRLQEGTFEPEALAPVARLFGVGDIVLRSDLEYERYRTPRPRALWALLTGEDVAGIGQPVPYGDPVPNRPDPRLPMLDEVELRIPDDAPHPPPAARFPVEDPQPIVRVAPVTRPVVLAGDGDGIVDAAAAGLVDGRSLVLQATSLPDEVLDEALGQDADLVLTDTYRRRIQTWFYAIRDTRGPTERAGETLPEPTGYDYRIDPTPEVGDERRTVVEHVGGSVSATAGGGASRPEDRAAAAFDGDPRTAWRVGGADPAGARLRLSLPVGTSAEEIVLVQPQDGPRDRVIERVRLRIDDQPALDVDLTPASEDPGGQVVPLADPDVREVDLEVLEVSQPPFDPALANAVGFAEVRVGGVVVTERVRVPTDLLDRASGGTGHPVDIVLSRLRYEPGERGRQDQERSLQRVMEVPSPRSFSLTGTLRVNPNAPDERLDEVLGTDLAGAVASASSHLPGDPGSRASRALDGDPTTAWRTAFGPQDGQYLTVRMASPTAMSGLVASVVNDDRHSTPGSLTLLADGEEVGTVPVPAGSVGAPIAVPLPDPPRPVSELRVVVGDVVAKTPVPGDPNPAEILPVGIVQLDGVGMPQAVDSPTVDPTCRPLLAVDGRPVMVRAIGTPAQARSGLDLDPCEGPVSWPAGPHTVESEVGLDGGLDVDRLVLSSQADGSPGTVVARGTPRSEAGAEVEVRADRRGTDYDLDVSTDGEPFWLVLGQSHSTGWELDVDGAGVGERQIVDGYANGWLIRPEGPGPLSVSLTWGPQRLVWITLAASGLAVVACLAVLVMARRRRGADEDLASAPALARPDAGRGVLTPAGAGLALAVGVGVLLVATPLAAVVGAGAVLLGLWLPRATWVWVAVAPALVLLAHHQDRPELAWVALALLAADLAVEGWSVRSLSRPDRAPDPPPAPEG